MLHLLLLGADTSSICMVITALNCHSLDGDTDKSNMVWVCGFEYILVSCVYVIPRQAAGRIEEKIEV